jgi:hypothetical protein
MGIMGSRHYIATAQLLIKRLRTEPRLVGIVLGYYYDAPSELMKRRLREVQRKLRESGIHPNRYFVRLSPWSGERSVDPPEREPVYPSFFAVEIVRIGNVE